jgi:hypothetical protein
VKDEFPVTGIDGAGEQGRLRLLRQPHRHCGAGENRVCGGGDWGAHRVGAEHVLVAIPVGLLRLWVIVVERPN